jgi:hypothetical protein
MQGEQKERWLELCELAAKEQDPGKLLRFVQEINHLLDEKQKRINQKSNPIAPHRKAG